MSVRLPISALARRLKFLANDLEETVAESYAEVLKKNVHLRFMPGNLQRYNMPNLSPGTIIAKKMKGKPIPLVDTGRLKDAVRTSLWKIRKIGNSWVVDAKLPEYAQTLRLQGFDFLRLTNQEVQDIMQSARKKIHARARAHAGRK